jgi:hypothetical protein
LTSELNNPFDITENYFKSQENENEITKVILNANNNKKPKILTFFYLKISKRMQSYVQNVLSLQLLMYYLATNLVGLNYYNNFLQLFEIFNYFNYQINVNEV